jgi:hypothetical protein
MAELTHNPLMVFEGVAHLLEQYKGSETLKKLLTIYLEEIQELEDTNFQVVLSRFLANAEDIQLDVLGALVGELRQGKNDAAFRIWIAARIRLNRSFGRPDDVIECLLLVTPAAFTYEEYSSAFFVVTFSEQPAFPNDITAIVYLAKAIGVGMMVIYPPDDGQVFLFRDNGAANDPAHGFSNFEAEI